MVDGEISFGRFWFDLTRRELYRDSRPVRLGSRALDILCVLASAEGALVTKDELMARVWPGVVVEENNLHFHISSLRKALDADGKGESWIVTVPGRLPAAPSTGTAGRRHCPCRTERGGFGAAVACGAAVQQSQR